MSEFKVIGTTDEVTTCDCCGRSDLKATVIMGVLDADGNVGNALHFGRTCAAKASGWAPKRVDKEVADLAKAEAARKAREDNIRRFNESQAYDSWKLATFGDAKDTLERHRRYLAQRRNR